MDPEFTVVGIAHGVHSVHKNMTVVTFSLSFIEGAAGQAPVTGQSTGSGTTTRAMTQRRTEEETIGMLRANALVGC
jgi:hypothetical protein